MRHRRAANKSAHPVETPTIRAIKAERGSASRYAFHLSGADLLRLGESGATDSAVLAYALIRAAAYGDRSEDWIRISGRVFDMAGRGYRWWYRATRQLEALGLIDCRRHRGRLPRYRLCQQTTAKSGD